MTLRMTWRSTNHQVLTNELSLLKTTMMMAVIVIIIIIIIIIVDSRNHRVSRICFRNLEESNFCFAEHRVCNGLTEGTAMS